VAPLYRKQPAWKLAVELAADLFRLAERLEGRLGDKLAGLAAALPARTAESAASACILEIEGLLAIAARLGRLPGADAASRIEALDRLRELVESPAPAPRPTAVPAAPTAPAPAARPPAPAARPAPPAPSGTDRLVLDGSNFLGRAPGYMLGDEQSHDRLLFRLQEYGRAHPAHRITAFFDGQRSTRRQVAGVEEQFTGGQRPADDVIVDFLRDLPDADRPRTTLVTDDRELASRAKTHGVRVESVSWLSERLARKPRQAPGQRPGLNQGELSEWEEYFKKPPQRPGR
jgi:hypothetical protein